MFDRDKWAEIFQALGKNKWRSALTAFGVFWGIFMMIIMMGAGSGLENGITRDMGRTVGNAVFMWTQGTTLPYKGFQVGRFWSFENDDITAIKEEVEGVEIIAPRCQLGGWRGGNNVIRGTKTAAFSIYGDYPQYFEISPLIVVQGRLINQADIAEKRKVCTIGKRVRETLYEPDENPIGTYISVQGIYFQVVGVFNPGTEGERGEDDEQTIYIPFTTFQSAFNWGNKIGWLVFTINPNYPTSAKEMEVANLLKSRHRVDPNDPRAVGSWNTEEEFTRVSNLFLGIRLLSLVVGIFTLLAGAIGISNIMLVVVKERTQELGIRRAIGATPWEVMQQIILEAITLTLVAGILGILAGVWLLEGINSLLTQFNAQSSSFSNPGVELGLVLAAFGILIFSGILAGIIPARKAVSVKPIEALRYEN